MRSVAMIADMNGTFLIFLINVPLPLDDKETEIKVDEKSLESVNKAIKSLFGSIGK